MNLANNIALSILLGAFCGVVLNIFYTVVRHAWPFNYFGLEGSADPVVSRNLPRYLLFRLGPPWLAGAFAGLVAEQLNLTPWIAILALVTVHLRATILSTIEHFRRRYQGPGIIRALTAGAVLACCFLGGHLRDLLDPIIPNPSELVANLWASVFAAIGAIFIQQIVLMKQTPVDLTRRSLAELPADLLLYAIAASQRAGVEMNATIALMCTENLERPKWVRRAESVLPKRLRLTTGVMQQVSALSDKASIDQAIREHISLWPRQNSEEYKNMQPSWWFGEQVKSYNSDRNFQGLAAAIFGALEEDTKLLTARVSSERKPIT